MFRALYTNARYLDMLHLTIRSDVRGTALEERKARESTALLTRTWPNGIGIVGLFASQQYEYCSTKYL